MPPEFYVTTYDQVCERIENLERATVGVIGRSAGDRPIVAASYGVAEPFKPTTHRVAGITEKDPARFCPQDRQRQVLLITSAFHGAEIESIAGVMNLISILETGQDLKEVAWPRISACAEKMRIVIVPVANPDGRVRVDSDDQQEWDWDTNLCYRHGRWKDGSLIMPEGNRMYQPLPAERVEYPGGYVNENGIEPTSGWIFDREENPEAWAVADLVRKEYPDGILDLHSCGAGPFMIVREGLLPPEYHERQTYIDGAFRDRLRERDLGARPWTVKGGRTKIIYNNEVYQQLSGCLPLCFESPNGVQKGNEFTHEQIVDQILTLCETVMEIACIEGLRPEGAL